MSRQGAVANRLKRSGYQHMRAHLAAPTKRPLKPCTHRQKVQEFSEHRHETFSSAYERIGKHAILMENGTEVSGVIASGVFTATDGTGRIWRKQDGVYVRKL